MKAEILKIAGVKNEAEFYRKFPTEEAFMEVYGKQFKKARLGVSMGISKAQKGKSMEQLASEKQRCGITERASKEDRAASRELMKLPDAVDIPEWQEISNIQNLGLDKKGRKALEKEFESIKSKYPGLDLPTYVAAVRDAGRTNIQFANPERAKYFDPATGALLPNVDRRSIDPYLRFYRGQFPTQSKIAPTDVLNTFVNMPGGLSNYSKYADVGYVPPIQKYGGETKKLKQLTSYEGDIDGVIPTAQTGDIIPELGLNSPASGVSMSLPVPQSAMNQYGYSNTDSISGGTAADQFAGINTAGTYEIDYSRMEPANTQLYDIIKNSNSNNFNKINSGVQMTSTIGSNVQKVGKAIEQKKQAKRLRKLLPIFAKASGTRDVDVANVKARNLKKQRDAMFQPIQPNQLSPSYGTGYDAGFAAKNGATLKAEGGMQIGGNLTEIQNTYAPNTLYDNLGYEPLGESDVVKQYYGGGYVQKAIGGAALPLIQEGVNMAGDLISGIIGIGTKRINKQNEKLLGQTAFQSGMQNLQQGQYSAYVKDGGIIPQHEEGGWVSHDWQPQVITHFGEHRVSDLLKADPTMDTLRSGGHIRQNKMFPKDQFAMGGELQTTWGGYAKPMTYNHHLPGTGEIAMFHGATHADGGIGVNYGGGGEYNPYTEYGKDGVEAKTHVEVESREPAVQLPDTSSQNQSSNFAFGGESSDKNLSLNVFGNLNVDKGLYPDNPFIAKFHGKTYKKAVKDIALLTEKENKKIAKAQNELNDLLQNGVHSSYDKLKLKSLELAIAGPDMKLANYANTIQDFAIGQNATNETAEEGKLDAKDLSQRKITPDKEAMKKTAKYGKEIFKAQTGSTIIPANQQTPPKRGQRRLVDNNSEVYDDATGNWISDAEYLKKYNLDGTPKQGAPKASTYTGGSVVDYLKSIGQPIDMAYRKKLAESKGIKNYKGTIPQNEQLLKILRDEEGPLLKQRVFDVEPIRSQKVPFDAKTSELASSVKAPRPFIPQEKKSKKGKFDWITAANALIPYLRPTDQEPLDPNQLMGEMFALSANVVEPVPMQSVQYQLETPYRISLQDQLNEITAQARDAMRMAQGDTSALAAISAQANMAKNKVLGDQMRINQEKEMETYARNLQTLKEQQLQNLGLYDKQYERQATARSKTKATEQEALSSIADKIQRNKLENRTLGIYENLYNYRFDPQGRAINMNPLAQFTAQVGDGGGRTTGGIAPGYEFTYDASGNIIGTRKSKKDDDTGRNGKIVRAIKNL